MSYVKINVWFYGALHDSSGLYFITKQQDKIDSQGYRTTLSLTRIPDAFNTNPASSVENYTGSEGASTESSGEYGVGTSSSNGVSFSNSESNVKSAYKNYTSSGGASVSGGGRSF